MQQGINSLIRAVSLRGLVCTVVAGVSLLGGASGIAHAADPAAKTGGGSVATSDPVEAVVQPVTQWLERANREYQDNIVKELSVPTGKSAPLEAAKSVQTPGGEPGVLDQIKGLLGLEMPKTAPADQAVAAQAREHEDGLKRQIEARRIEQERNIEALRVAEQQKVAAEAKKAAELDAVTRQSQKTAEVARLAEEERRRTGGAAPDDRAAIERKLAAAADRAAGEKAENDRRTATALDKAAGDKAAAERKVVAAAEKAAADKAVTERKAAAAAEKAVADKAVAERKVAAAAEKVAGDKAVAERKVAAAAEKVSGDKAGDAAKRAKVAGGDDKVAGIGASPATSSDVGPDKAGKSRIKVASRRGPGGAGRCSRAGRDVDVPAVYVVKSGDTLWDISRRYYDKGHKFEKILRANADKIGSPDLIYPCQRFYLPGRHAFFLVMPGDVADAS